MLVLVNSSQVKKVSLGSQVMFGYIRLCNVRLDHVRIGQVKPG
jgi:hypothetical protein